LRTEQDPAIRPNGDIATHHYIGWAATLKRPSLSLKARETLLEYYRTDLINLERMLQVDLSHWLRLEKQPVADERVS